MARKAADLVAGLYNIAFETDSAGKFYAIAPGDEGADFDTESPIHVHKGRPDELQVRVSVLWWTGRCFVIDPSFE